jgi:hypothetical protein
MGKVFLRFKNFKTEICRFVPHHTMLTYKHRTFREWGCLTMPKKQCQHQEKMKCFYEFSFLAKKFKNNFSL